MQFDPDNAIVKLCAQGMALEGEGKNDQARSMFQQAWEEAATDSEKFIAAHYLARHQRDTEDKLKWDSVALEFALKINDPSIKTVFPSLYLNIGKCHEDLGNPEKAMEHYRLALSFADQLPGDGYGKMIRNGIENGLKRLGV